jgi:hypothetical protein
VVAHSEHANEIPFGRFLLFDRKIKVMHFFNIMAEQKLNISIKIEHFYFVVTFVVVKVKKKGQYFFLVPDNNIQKTYYVG